MVVKVETQAYRARLEQRLKILESILKRRQLNYRRDKALWDRDIVAWTKANVKKLTQLDFDKSSRIYSECGDVGFSTKAFFAGAPKMPPPPEDKRLRVIRALIDQTSLTQEKFLKVTTADIDFLFSTDSLHDED